MLSISKPRTICFIPFPRHSLDPGRLYSERVSSSHTVIQCFQTGLFRPSEMATALMVLHWQRVEVGAWGGGKTFCTVYRTGSLQYLTTLRKRSLKLHRQSETAHLFYVNKRKEAHKFSTKINTAKYGEYN